MFLDNYTVNLKSRLGSVLYICVFNSSQCSCVQVRLSIRVLTFTQFMSFYWFKSIPTFACKWHIKSLHSSSVKQKTNGWFHFKLNQHGTFVKRRPRSGKDPLLESVYRSSQRCSIALCFLCWWFFQCNFQHFVQCNSIKKKKPNTLLPFNLEGSFQKIQCAKNSSFWKFRQELRRVGRT